MPILSPSRPALRRVATSGLSLLPSASGEGRAPDAAGEWRAAFEALKRENAELRARLAALAESERLVPLDPAYWERLPLRVEAAVVARDASPWRGSAVISAGSREGVREGAPVVVGAALVGRVAEVGPITSRVRLLGDPGVAVWGMILSGKQEADGAVVGVGGDLLSMERVAAGTGAPGDPVYTTGGDGFAPRGLKLGTVERIDDVNRDGVAEVEVRPALDPASLGVVNVLVLPE